MWRRMTRASIRNSQLLRPLLGLLSCIRRHEYEGLGQDIDGIDYGDNRQRFSQRLPNIYTYSLVGYDAFSHADRTVDKVITRREQRAQRAKITTP